MQKFETVLGTDVLICQNISLWAIHTLPLLLPNPSCPLQLVHRSHYPTLLLWALNMLNSRFRCSTDSKLRNLWNWRSILAFYQTGHW